MKIFSAAQIKACDSYTIHAANISSIELIERAANACAEQIVQHFGNDTPFVLLCGMGNNGADGLALGNILKQKGFAVKTFMLLHSNEHSTENKSILNKLLKINANLVDYIQPDTFLADLPKGVVIIDAILGTGLARPTENWLSEFIEHINQLPNYKIAIDIPSGMPADTIPKVESSIIKANETYSFQFYKRSFLHEETAKYCGEIFLLDIGLHQTFIEGTQTHYQTIEAQKLRGFIKRKDPFSYKSQHGHTYIIGGSKGKTGAVLLATNATLRTGVGLVTSIIPEACYISLQSASPEAMCSVSGKDVIEQISEFTSATAFGIGVGMGMNKLTVNGFAQFIEACTLPTVFDADALNILANHPELMNKIPANSILTPHVAECDRLFGESTNSMQRAENIRIQAMRYKVCIVLKGHHTIIATPDGDCFYNTNGNAGMAKGGSGDVLTGLLAGLLAQAYTATQSALLGVYLHGLSGDISAQQLSMQAMNASDLVNNLSIAWQKLAKS